MSSCSLDLICLLDVETTGINPTTNEVIELGCILFSLSHNCVLQQVSTLVPIEGNNTARSINGISRNAANSIGMLGAFEGVFEELFIGADALVAHNAFFDRSFTPEWLRAINDTWIDTRSVTWPRANRQGCNLVELALCYDIPVWSNHRALKDCQLLAHIVEREPMAAQLLAKELGPKVWATWRSTPDDKQGQQMVKAAGFRWNRPECPASRVWSRLMHPDDATGLGFEVVTMEVNAA